jgi:hypothetical protein
MLLLPVIGFSSSAHNAESIDEKTINQAGVQVARTWPIAFDQERRLCGMHFRKAMDRSFALAVSFAGASSADEDTTPPQVIVKYSDLNPPSSPGASVLYGRIYHAARKRR